MKQLHPNAVIIFYIQGVFLSIFLGGFLLLFPVMLLFGLASERTISFVWGLVLIFVSIPAMFLLPLPWAQLSYKNFGFKLEDDRIVIEKGVIWKRHVSIPYERIQNIDIIRGPIARMLGLADLQIQTAGISGVAIMEGRIPALSPEEAVKLKDQMLVQVTRSKNQGL